jgi:hypothetical protein
MSEEMKRLFLKSQMSEDGGREERKCEPELEEEKNIC